MDPRLRIVFDTRKLCWRVDEWVGAWNKWSIVMFWRDQNRRPLPLEGAADAIVTKLREADWARYGQALGARSQINRDIPSEVVRERDRDEERYRFNHHARDLYLRQMGLRKTFGPGPITRLDSKEKAGYLHQLIRSTERNGKVWMPR